MKNSLLSRNIKKLRHFKNLNQNEFAELIEVSRAALAAYEEGRAEPKLATLFLISQKFDISMNEIYGKELTVNDIAGIQDELLFQQKSIELILEKMQNKINHMDDNIKNLSKLINSKK